MTAYIDASALLRLLFGETGETFPTDDDIDRCSSELIEVEAARAVDRLRLSGQIDDGECARKMAELRDLLESLHLVPVNSAVVRLASAPFGVGVRALDALHVASAQWFQSELGVRLSFWTHDRRQGIAALSRGLTVAGVTI